MLNLILRLLFLVGDMVGNMYMLSTRQPFIIGADYSQSIVFFNAAVIVLICIIDFIIVKTQRLRIDLEIGEGLTDLHKHER
jgi:hypothetical protein